MTVTPSLDPCSGSTEGVDREGGVGETHLQEGGGDRRAGMGLRGELQAGADGEDVRVMLPVETGLVPATQVAEEKISAVPRGWGTVSWDARGGGGGGSGTDWRVLSDTHAGSARVCFIAARPVDGRGRR